MIVLYVKIVQLQKVVIKIGFHCLSIINIDLRGTVEAIVIAIVLKDLRFLKRLPSQITYCEGAVPPFGCKGNYIIFAFARGAQQQRKGVKRILNVPNPCKTYRRY